MTTPPPVPAPTISLAGFLADLKAIGKMAEADALAALKSLEADVATTLLPALEGLAGSVVTALAGIVSGLFAGAIQSVTSVSGTTNEDLPMSEMTITTGDVVGGPSAVAIRQAYSLALAIKLAAAQKKVAPTAS